MRCRPQIGISSLLLQHRFSCNGRITAAKTVQRKLDICLAYSTRGSNVAAWLSTEILMELVVLSLSSAVRDIAQILWPVLRPPRHAPIRCTPCTSGQGRQRFAPRYSGKLNLPKRQRSNTALNDCRLVQPAAVRPRTRHRLFELVVRAAGTNGLTASKTTHISLPESRTTKRRARRRPTSPTASSKGCR